MTQPTTPTLTVRVGQRVVVRPEHVVPGVGGRVFVIDKVNPKNLRCKAEDGGRGLNYPRAYLMDFTGEMPAAPTYTEILSTPTLGNGAIVTLKTPYKDITTETPLVVLADKFERINVARLGGVDGLRYYRMPRGSLVVRDLAWLTATLAAQVNG